MTLLARKALRFPSESPVIDYIGTGYEYILNSLEYQINQVISHSNPDADDIWLYIGCVYQEYHSGRIVYLYDPNTDTHYEFEQLYPMAMSAAGDLDQPGCFWCRLKMPVPLGTYRLAFGHYTFESPLQVRFVKYTVSNLNTTNPNTTVNWSTHMGGSPTFTLAPGESALTLAANGITNTPPPNALCSLGSGNSSCEFIRMDNWSLREEVINDDYHKFALGETYNSAGNRDYDHQPLISSSSPSYGASSTLILRGP